MREFDDSAINDIAIPELVAETSRCLADLHAGWATQSPKTVLPLGETGFFLSVAGVVPRLGLAAAKWASYAPGEPGVPGLSTSTIVVSDASDGQPLAVISGMRATHLRTAATAATLIQRWKPTGADVLVLVGFGPTNRTVLEVLDKLRYPVGELRIVVRSAESAQRVRLEHPGVTVTEDARAALAGASIAVSATGSSTPVASMADMTPGAVVVCLDGLRTWDGYQRHDLADDRGTPGVIPVGRALAEGPLPGRSMMFDIAGSAVTDVALAAQLGVAR